MNINFERMSRHNLVSHYHCHKDSYDELIDQQGEIRHPLAKVTDFFCHLSPQQYQHFQQQAYHHQQLHGVTFNTYTNHAEANSPQQETIFPFDIFPRVILQSEWHFLEKGLKQRIKALNLFLNDIYGQQHCIKDNIVPRELIESSAGYLPVLRHLSPPGHTYIHVAGIDLIKNTNGQCLVLEDNLRTPSGVAYALENRHMMKHLFPDLFRQYSIEEIDDYPLHLHHALTSIMIKDKAPGILVLLTPGHANAAYFEHVYLAKKMGCPLVQGSDLFVENEKVYLKTRNGPIRVNCIYRRIDDQFLDPEMFYSHSLLGVRHLMKAYQAGNVVLANAPGNGVADDKLIYPYVPALIRYFLAEEPILPQVHTYSCCNKKDRDYVLTHLPSLVIKMADQSGGYGMLIGSQATKQELKTCQMQIINNPRLYMAQPIINLSHYPTWDGYNLVPRRVDLRPFIVTGTSSWVLPGGLTRVALKQHSYIVNSSQGGGSKDTWIVGESKQ